MNVNPVVLAEVGVRFGSLQLGMNVSPPVQSAEAEIAIRYGQIRLGASVDVPQVPSAIIGVQYGQLRLGAEVRVPQVVDATIGIQYGQLRLGAIAAVTPNTTVGIQYGQLRLGASATVTPNAAGGVSYGQLRLGANVNVVQPGLDLTGLQAWYSFNDDIISDVSGNGKDWTIVGGGDLQNAPGKVGNGVEKTSTSTSSYLEQPSARSNEFFGTQWYVSFWIKRSGSGNRVPMDVGNDSADGIWRIFWFTGGAFEYRLRTSDGNPAITTAIASNDEMMLVELYYNASNQEFGIAFDGGTFTTETTTGTIATTTRPFRLFRRGFSSNVYVGVIDELTIWDTMPASFAPTDPRREYLWNDGAGNTYPT